MKLISFLASFLVAGAGQALKREYRKGLLFGSAWLGSAGLLLLGLSYEGLWALGSTLVGALALGFTWIYNLVDILSGTKSKKRANKVEDKYDKLYLRGQSLYLKGQYEQAVKMFQLIYKKNKNDASVIHQLAKTYEKLGQDKLAKKAMKRYQEFDHELVTQR